MTRQRDALSQARRELPMVKVEKEYAFEGPNGPMTLRDLFGPHRRLIIYHLGDLRAPSLRRIRSNPF